MSVPLVAPTPAMFVPAANSVESAVSMLDEMIVGEYPSPELFAEAPATALYNLIPHHAQLLTHAMGIFNALNECASLTIPNPLDFECYMCLACAFQACDLVDYFETIRENHPDDHFKLDFADTAQTWLTGCKSQYTTLLLELHTVISVPPPVLL